jgi:hypothetical protein
LLRKAGQNFCNISPLDMKVLMGDQDNIGETLRAYIQAFTRAVRDIFESFEFSLQVEKLDKANADLLVERANVSTLKGTIESNARVAEANRRAGEALSAAMAGSVKAIDAQSTASARQTAELAKRLAAAGKNASNTESVVTEDVWARL